MASAEYSEEVTCAVCRTLFTDPVTLPCGHSFCRRCVGAPRCPPTSLTLERLAEKLKRDNGSGRAEVSELCPEHEEKFKLACVVCRDQERHDGHQFKPVQEAAASLRQELEEDVEAFGGDIAATERLAHAQRDAMAKTEEKSQQLATQIQTQFEEMHRFLRKREDEMKDELRRQDEATVEAMRVSLDAMETALSESREAKAERTSVLQIEDSEGFLRSWTRGPAPQRSFRPRANALQVVDTSLSLGPYESHLQFFVWKEMLQVIQPRAELLSLKTTSADITVSDDGRSLFCTPESKQAPSGFDQSKSFGTSAFGQSQGVSSTSAFGQTKGVGSTLAFGQGVGSTSAFGQTKGVGSTSAFDQTKGVGSTLAFDQTKRLAFT